MTRLCLFLSAVIYGRKSGHNVGWGVKRMAKASHNLNFSSDASGKAYG